MAASSKKISILICDDVRHEIGGKVSIMGVYGKDIRFSKIPTTMRQLGIVVIMQNLERPLNSVHVTIKMPGNDDLTKMITVPMEPAPNNNKYDANLVMLVNAVPIKETGEAKIELRESKGKKPIETLIFQLAEQKPDSNK